jgi:hypothetical protein
MALDIKPLSLPEFVTWLEEPGFSFARYGDGTFFSLWGMEGFNCDKAVVSGDQAELLEATIRDNSITHGMGDLAVSLGRAEEWLVQKGIDIEWYDCNVLHTASVQGELNPFVQLLRKRKLLLIGPTHVATLKTIPITAFVTTHPTRAFYEVDSLEKKARNLIEKKKIDTVCISAATAAPVLVSRLHKRYPELNVLDVGSLWDVYVGRASRKVFRDMTYAQIRKLKIKNFQ